MGRRQYQIAYQKVLNKQTFSSLTFLTIQQNRLLNSALKEVSLEDIPDFYLQNSSFFNSKLTETLDKHTKNLIKFNFIANNIKPFDIDFKKQEYIFNRVNNITATITNTASKRARIIINRLKNKGSKLPEIKKTLKRDNFVRSDRIARTEIHRTATKNQQDIAKEIGNVLREWITASDERAREDHVLADGQRINADGSFFVGNEFVPSPGFGSAKNSINCRCATRIIVKK